MKEDVLSGKTIITTRPAGKADALARQLTHAGATVYNLPTIEIQPVRYNNNTGNIMHQLDRFDWLLFTSPNGVHSFIRLLKEAGNTIDLPHGLQVGVFGEKGARVLRSYGITPGYVEKAKTAHEFFNQMRKKKLQRNQKVLLALGDRADKKYESYFKGFVNYTRLDVYQTTLPKQVDRKILNRIAENRYDLIVFTSPSTFHNLIELLGNRADLKNIRAASIGYTTTETMKRNGCKPLLTADEPDLQTLAKDIIRYFQSQKNPY
jgi:uroporphyrinogen-III synthase